MAQIHKCGVCSGEFATEKKYLDHICKKTGYQPSDFRHQVALDPQYEQKSQAALARGVARAEKTADKPAANSPAPEQPSGEEPGTVTL